MPKPIRMEELQQYGISQNHEIMDNGERRFRLTSKDGSGYIRCENDKDNVWENSHSHHTLQEMILVQKGCMIYVEYRGDKAEFQKMSAGDYVITVPDIPHNSCLSANTVIHTIKFGDCSRQDWIAYAPLDNVTKCMTFQQALERAEQEMLFHRNETQD